MWRLVKAEFLYGVWRYLFLLAFPLSVMVYALLKLPLGVVLPQKVLIVAVPSFVMLLCTPPLGFQVWTLHTEVTDKRLRLLSPLPLTPGRINFYRMLLALVALTVMFMVALVFSRMFKINGQFVSIWSMLSVSFLAVWLLGVQLAFHEAQFMEGGKGLMVRIIQAAANATLISLIMIFDATRAIAWRLMAQPVGVIICAALALTSLLVAHRVFLGRGSYVEKAR